MEDEFLPFAFSSVSIPERWSPEMACELVDFLSDIICAIWATHGAAMAQYLERPVIQRATEIVPDDDLPF